MPAPGQPAGWPTQPIPDSNRKGRTIVITIALLLGGLFLAGILSGPAPDEAPASGIGSGIGTADATADVSHLTLGSPDTLGMRPGFVIITNHSEKPSDYYIELTVLAGETNVGMTNATASHVQPGQVARATFTVVEPDATTVKLATVQRTEAL